MFWRVGLPVCPSPSCAGRPEPAQRHVGHILKKSRGSGSCAGGLGPRTLTTDSAADAFERRPDVPWAITFDLRERNTLWTDENQARLVKLFVGEVLCEEGEVVEARLQQLCHLLPDLGGRVATLQYDLLADLLRDVPKTAQKLVLLRDRLPHMDISAVMSFSPALLQQGVEEIIGKVEAIAGLLELEPQEAQRFLSQHPRFLAGGSLLVEEVLAELKRLMPQCDAQMVLRTEPSWLLRVESGTRRLGCHPD